MPWRRYQRDSRFMFTPNGRHEFVPRDQVFRLFLVYSLLPLDKNKQFYASFDHRNHSGLYIYICVFFPWRRYQRDSRFMFTPNGRHEFVPRDQVFRLFLVYSLLPLDKNKQFYASFDHRNHSGLYIYICLFSIVRNSQLESAVCGKRKS